MTEPPSGQGQSQSEPEVAGGNNTNRTDAVLDVMLAAGQMQVAAMTAASRLLSSWAQSADRYAEALGTEIRDLLEGKVPADEAATRFADAARAYLRELTE